MAGDSTITRLAPFADLKAIFLNAEGLEPAEAITFFVVFVADFFTAAFPAFFAVLLADLPAAFEVELFRATDFFAAVRDFVVVFLIVLLGI
ncbi:hypothetical protein KKC97_11455 [bacterium]|nr:hypothetical protein [bacterium]